MNSSCHLSRFKDTIRSADSLLPTFADVAETIDSEKAAEFASGHEHVGLVIIVSTSRVIGIVIP